jgi:para-aminobenzoate synthetase component 1
MRSYVILFSLPHNKALNLHLKRTEMLTNITTLRTKMNGFGLSHKPFVFAIDYEMDKCLFFDDPMTCAEINWATEKASNNSRVSIDCVNSPKLEIKHVLSLVDYKRKFDVVRAGLMHGDSFLTNLTVGVEVECNLTFAELYQQCNAKYKLLIPNEFVCFSPESFITINADKIYAYPMKGTIDATLPDAEALLMNSYKEKCEHNTIVDLLRNDLSMISENVRVKRYRYIDRIKTQTGEILQTSSEIVGNLTSDWHKNIGNIICELLPAGSICGAPKPATVQLIADAERSPRGWYTGVWGYYDGASLDTAVMIRCLAYENGKTFFHSGGGITVNSCAEDEYNEVLQKIYLPIK